MKAFPESHVCPLAVERNELRCADPSGKPDEACNACRRRLMGELSDAMREGNASLFEMLFVGHALNCEGFVGVRNEEGGIQLKRSGDNFLERPGDCIIDALPSVMGGGYELFVAIDDDHEIAEVFDTLDGAMSAYFDRKQTIEELAKGMPSQRRAGN